MTTKKKSTALTLWQARPKPIYIIVLTHPVYTRIPIYWKGTLNKQGDPEYSDDIRDAGIFTSEYLADFFSKSIGQGAEVKEYIS